MAKIDRDDLRDAIHSLDDGEQDLIISRYYNNLTIREAGCQLGLSQSQAYRLHESALRKLTGLMEEGEA